MVKYFFSILLIFNTLCAFSQNWDCNFNRLGKEYALEDMAKNTPRLIVLGGKIISTQANFEQKYQLKYEDFGCIPPIDSCVWAYHQVIFEYLDTTFGRKWQREIRSDVLFFQIWKKEQRKLRWRRFWHF
jgi:hypothetical protein